MENSLLNAFFSSGNQMESVLGIGKIFVLLGHSITLGLILSTITYLTTMNTFKTSIGDKEKIKKLRPQTLLGSSNILFLCVGLTGIMILVNNNLARALAIGATMSLMRFRIKLGQKNLSSNFLFGIIAGVACGIHALKVAWCLTILNIFMQGTLFFFIGQLNKSSGTKSNIRDNEMEEFTVS